MAEHDILRGSHAWERLQGGIPENVAPTELRRILHDWANVQTILIATVNELLDARDVAKDEIAAALERAHEAVAMAKDEADKEHGRIHQRIDRRGDAIEALKTDCANATRDLERRLYDGENGTIPTLAKKSDVSALTKLLWTVLVSVTGAAILLAMNLVATKGGS